MLLTPPGVYRPQSDSQMLARAVAVSGRARGAVLDLGTGTGTVALAAARCGAGAVTAVDLSRRAVVAARLNARLHRATLTVHRGDLFAPVRGRRFALVTANPPYVPSHSDRLARYRRARSWDGGRDGRAVVDRICDDVADHLEPGGALLMVHSAVSGVRASLDRLAASGLTARVVDRTRIPLGPVMRARAVLHETRGLVEPGAADEELVVIEAVRER
ncbi:HemK2/MTQ2 family protein methyltransferase [Pseudonocardia sp. ICBG1293]|uniref:HemK2/MTQ2 family protein methyltransferase n=1 Tax=Pseudonocardia sp. ICBG1293 TaxID=2844382 RepID=UPI001CCACD7B|nr:HemK2/MTQ2 family protein methyltransferase [Pseudonocardia sp. ICBG1293]